MNVHERLCALLDRKARSIALSSMNRRDARNSSRRFRGNKPEQAIKSIVVQVRFGKKESRYYLANVPGHCRVDLSAIQSIFNGTDASVAPREKAEALTGCVIGAIPPFSFNDQLILLADPLIQENEEVVFNAGRLDRSIFMKSIDYFRIAKPQLLNIALRT